VTLNSKEKIKMEKAEEFFIFLVGNDKFAVKLKYFEKVIGCERDCKKVFYKDKDLKALDTKKLLDYGSGYEKNIALILKYKSYYFAIQIDEVLDNFILLANEIKTLDIISKENTLVSGAILKDKEIIKILSIQSLYNLSK
jgi:chemotaxis signal transduction protein